MSEHRVKIENGKYEFIRSRFNELCIYRGGKPWHRQSDGPIAQIDSMMAELDAARVVLAAARETVEMHHEGIAPILALRDALEKHARLVDDREPPSQWTT